MFQIDLICIISWNGSSWLSSLDFCRCGCWCNIGGTFKGGGSSRTKDATYSDVPRGWHVLPLLLILGVVFAPPLLFGGGGYDWSWHITINGISTCEMESHVPGTTNGVGVVPRGSHSIAMVLRLVIDEDTWCVRPASDGGFRVLVVVSDKFAASVMGWTLPKMMLSLLPVFISEVVSLSRWVASGKVDGCNSFPGTSPRFEVLSSRKTRLFEEGETNSWCAVPSEYLISPECVWCRFSSALWSVNTTWLTSERFFFSAVQRRYFSACSWRSKFEIFASNSLFLSKSDCHIGGMLLNDLLQLSLTVTCLNNEELYPLPLSPPTVHISHQNDILYH